MTEQQIRACFRLGVQVFLRSDRTGRVWGISLDHRTDRFRGHPPRNGPATHADYLTAYQVDWHLKNKPHNFSTTYDRATDPSDPATGHPCLPVP